MFGNTCRINTSSNSDLALAGCTGPPNEVGVLISDTSARGMSRAANSKFAIEKHMWYVFCNPVRTASMHLVDTSKAVRRAATKT